MVPPASLMATCDLRPDLIPEDDFAVLDDEECDRLGAGRAVTAAALPVAEAERRRHRAAVFLQRDDPPGAREAGVPRDRVGVRVQAQQHATLNDRGIGCEERGGTLVVVGLQGLAPRADDVTGPSRMPAAARDRDQQEDEPEREAPRTCGHDRLSI